MASINSDVIASASLLLALVASLFGLWYLEIDRALTEAEPEGTVARRVVRNRVGLVLWNKALPLAGTAGAVAAIFMPRAVAIVISCISLIGKDWQYDDLMAAFVLTQAILTALAVLTVLRAGRLFAKWIALV